MMLTHKVRLDEIYIPVKLKKEIDPAKVGALAESILEKGLEVPIQVRREEAKNRYILVTGLHRLEAMRALGEDTIDALFVSARKF